MKYCHFPLLLALLAPPAFGQAAQEPFYACQPGATLTFPLSEVIEEPPQFILLGDHAPNSAEDIIFGHADYRAMQEQLIADQTKRSDDAWTHLNSLPQNAQDVALLISFASKQRNKLIPMVTFATSTDDRFVAAYIDALKRHGLDDQARIAEAAINVFPPDARSSHVRMRLAKDPTDAVSTGRLMSQLIVLQEELTPLLPPVFQRAAGIVAGDPGLLAFYEGQRTKAGPNRKRQWLAAELKACAPNWLIESEFSDPFANLPAAQHDFILLSMFDDGFVTGGLREFLAQPAGALAPEVEQTLRQNGLPDVADDLLKGMQFYGSPYPRALPDRQAIQQNLTPAQDEWLWRGDGNNAEMVDRLATTLNELAVSSGLMPELAGSRQ